MSDQSNAHPPHIDHPALKEWFYQTEPEPAMHKSTTSKKIGKRFVGRVSTILLVVVVVVGRRAKHEFADLEWDISISVSSIKPPWLVDSN